MCVRAHTHTHACTHTHRKIIILKMWIISLLSWNISFVWQNILVVGFRWMANCNIAFNHTSAVVWSCQSSVLCKTRTFLMAKANNEVNKLNPWENKTSTLKPFVEERNIPDTCFCYLSQHVANTKDHDNLIWRASIFCVCTGHWNMLP